MEHLIKTNNLLTDIWNFYLPYLYSCMSLLGVVMLLSKYRCVFTYDSVINY